MGNLYTKLYWKYKHWTYCTIKPRLYYSVDGEFGSCTGWLLTAPYGGRKWLLFGPRNNAISAPLMYFKDKYVSTVTGLKARIIKFLGRNILEHPEFSLWVFNCTVYRIITGAQHG